MQHSAFWHAASVTLVVTCGLGCGAGTSEKLVSVTGTVMLDGAPLDGATVAFIPAKSKQPQPSWGYSDAAGNYQLKTPEGKTGISLGEYRIVVSKLVQKDGSPIPKGSQTAAADGLELVPFPHSDPRQTKNVAIVTKNGEVFDVEMTSKSGKDAKPQ